MTTHDLIGYAAAALTTVSFVPQALVILVTKLRHRDSNRKDAP